MTRFKSSLNDVFDEDDEWVWISCDVKIANEFARISVDTIQLKITWQSWWIISSWFCAWSTSKQQLVDNYFINVYVLLITFASFWCSLFNFSAFFRRIVIVIMNQHEQKVLIDIVEFRNFSRFVVFFLLIFSIIVTLNEVQKLIRMILRDFQLIINYSQNLQIRIIIELKIVLTVCALRSIVRAQSSRLSWHALSARNCFNKLKWKLYSISICLKNNWKWIDIW